MLLLRISLICLCGIVFGNSSFSLESPNSSFISEGSFVSDSGIETFIYKDVNPIWASREEVVFCPGNEDKLHIFAFNVGQANCILQNTKPEHTLAYMKIFNTQQNRVTGKLC